MNIVFEREVLFRDVWEFPIATLAKKYGLSDSGLRKICISLSIPLPAPGHWAKVRAGHQIATPPLPPTSGRTHFVCRSIVEQDSEVLLPKDDPWLKERLAFEIDLANAVYVPEVLLRPHPIVATTVKAVRTEISGLEKSRTWRRRPQRPGAPVEPDWSFDARPSWHDYERRGHIMELRQDVLPMRVSIETSSRALRIWDALIKACIARGMRVSVEPRALKVSHGVDWVGLRLSEKVDRVAGPGARNVDGPTIRVASGSLRMFVIHCGETKFEDRPDRSLDRQLNDVLRRIHYSMASQRYQGRVRTEQRRRLEVAREAEELERIAAAEARRRLDEEERFQQAAQAKIEAAKEREIERERLLVVEANAWRQAETIRAYVAHLTVAIAACGAPAAPEVYAWLNWAAEVADRLDPSSTRSG